MPDDEEGGCWEAAEEVEEEMLGPEGPAAA
jgi:hypothetical protein